MSLKTTIVTDSISNHKKLIQCVCEDSAYSSEELVLQCMLCKCWLHGKCIGFGKRGNTPAEFICVFCGTAISVLQCNGREGIGDVPVLNEDSDYIVCHCEEQSESGFMIQCEHCFTWQHGECMMLKNGENPPNYRCHICKSASDKLEEDPYNITEQIMEENGKETKEVETEEVERTESEKNDVCSYNCKICGVDFDNGRALIYHKSYEKCTPNVGKGHPKTMIESRSKSEQNIPSDNFKNENSCKTNGNSRSFIKNDLKKKSKSEDMPGDALSEMKDGKSLETTVIGEIICLDTIDSATLNISEGHNAVNSTTKIQGNNLDGTIHDVEISPASNDLTTVKHGKGSLAIPKAKSLKKSHKIHSQCETHSETTHHTQQSTSQDDQDAINCLCGSDVEIGLMIQCEICQSWQHTVCIGIGKKQNLPKNYFCYDCMNKGCFSIILELSKLSVETIAEKFHQKFVEKSRKRKISQSGFSTKRPKPIQDSSSYSEQSDEPYSQSEDSLLDESFSKTQNKSLAKNVRPQFTKDPLSRPLIRPSTSELAAMKHLLSTFFSETRLFTQLLPRTSNFKRVTYTEVLELLPAPINFPNIEITSDLNETVHTTSVNYLSSTNYPHGNQLLLNVGAPVTALAWVPGVSDMDNAIYLAVTTQSSVACKDHLFSIEIDSQTSDVVQIWSVSQFTNDVCLALGLILRQGKVMDMQWCPSGCFDDVTLDLPSNARLGLLLVALNTGQLGIISVPHPTVLNTQDVHSSNWFNNQFYEVESFDAILILEDNPTPEAGNKCICCDWSLQNNHSRVVAGFQNGVVAVWNLKAKLFCKNTNFRPILMIKAHSNPVISVVWSPQHPHLFASASHDLYTALIWDTRQTQVHSADLNTTQVSITWSMCWPINYLRPICGVEVLPKKNEFAWYGNLITNSFRSISTSYRYQLGGHYQQCPTISSVSWCRKDCSLLLGSFSGELLFLYSFHSCKKTKLRATQARKLMDISIRSDDECNQLTMNPFDINKIQAVAIDFNFSSFRNEETLTEFKYSELSQMALVKRLMKPEQQQKSTKFTSECKKCGKKFLTKTSVNYHQKHDVCRNGSVIDNRGNFFRPTAIRENIADQLMLQQLKSKENSKQVISNFEKKNFSKSQGKSNISTGKLDSSLRSRVREKPPDKYQECSHSQIKQVKWFPCEPYQNVFAVGTGLGLITISYLPET